MAEPAIFFEEVNERQGTFHRRAFLLGGFFGVGLVALGGRLAHLQLLETQRYEKLSAGNQFNFKPGAAAARPDPRPQRRVAGVQSAELPAAHGNKRQGLRHRRRSCTTLAEFVPLDEARQSGPRHQGNWTARRVRRRCVVMEDMSWEEFSARQRARPGAAQRHRRHGRGAGLSVRGRLRPRDRLRRQGQRPTT
jgi:penicillin-binding protein 2